jgi:hypothetical protein
MKIKWSQIPWEAVIWTCGLVYLACIDPRVTHHLTICPLRLLGFEHCPGCGLGLSISYLLHGDLAGSWNTHPLGIFALPVLVWRIFSLIRHFVRYTLIPKHRKVSYDQCYADSSRA